MSQKPVSGGLPQEVIEEINRIAADLQYGTITLVFHDGKVIQVERNEKVRLNSPGNKR
jgi:hypothetical protein